MIKIGYFPGCSLLGTAQEYDSSLKAVAKAFDIELVEIKDWNCCGATAAHNLNHMLSLALPARTLALAEEQNFAEILAPCAACYNRLFSAWHELKFDEAQRMKVSKLIEMPLNCMAKPVNVIEFLNKYIIPELSNKDIKKFQRKAACYYGCLLVRPDKLLKFDRYEDPQAMEDIIKILGSQPIDWGFKTECCGASLSIARTDIVAKLSGKIVDNAIQSGAETIVVACPMCQSNLDMRRPEINESIKKETTIPILYITQVLGMALGIPEKELALDKHFVSPLPMLHSPVTIQEGKPKPKPKMEQEA